MTISVYVLLSITTSFFSILLLLTDDKTIILLVKRGDKVEVISSKKRPYDNGMGIIRWLSSFLNQTLSFFLAYFWEMDGDMYRRNTHDYTT